MDISAAITSISTATELVKLIISSKVEDKVKNKALELELTMLSLHGVILMLYSQNHELSELKNKLQNELEKIEDFNEKAKRYEPHELCPGTVVYRLKKLYARKEPDHYICPYCYDQRKRSILQYYKQAADGTVYRCQMHPCNAEFIDQSKPWIPAI